MLALVLMELKVHWKKQAYKSHHGCGSRGGSLHLAGVHRSRSRLGCFPRDPGCAFIPTTRGVSQVENRCGRSHGYLKPVQPEWPAGGSEEGPQGRNQEAEL